MQTIQWFDPQAYKTLSNSHGMEIMVDETCEKVHYRYTNDKEVYTEQIQFDQDGDPYFMINFDTVHYLNEFIKIEWL